MVAVHIHDCHISIPIVYESVEDSLAVGLRILIMALAVAYVGAVIIHAVDALVVSSLLTGGAYHTLACV